MMPVALLIMAMGIILFFGYSVIPAFAETFPMENWAGVGYGLVIVSAIADTWTVPIVIFLASIVAAVAYALPRWVGPTRVQADEYVPFSLYRLVNGAGFMLSMAALLRAGVSNGEALATLREGASPWYQERINAAIRHVNNGKNLGEALQLAGHNFPDPDTVADLCDYSELNSLEEVMEQLAKAWVADSKQRVESQMAVVKQLGLVVVAGIFGLVMAGLFSLQGQMQEHFRNMASLVPGLPLVG